MRTAILLASGILFGLGNVSFIDDWNFMGLFAEITDIFVIALAILTAFGDSALCLFIGVGADTFELFAILHDL